MSLFIPTPTVDTPTEHLAGSVERVTFHSEETGFCVLRVKVRGHRDLVTVVGTAPSITPGEYIEADGWWITDRTHGLQFKTPQRLRELDGIGPKRTARVVAAWAEQRVVREIMVFLHSHGVGTARAVRIYKTYGTDAIA